MSRRRRNFLIGFAIGAVLLGGSALIGKPMPPHIGAWIDWTVEAALAGALIGVIVAWFGERGKKAD